jgi:hypothetical protein
MIIPSNEIELEPCECGGRAEYVDDTTVNGLRVLSIVCPKCGKRTPRLLCYVAGVYWNQIAGKQTPPRKLIYNEWGTCHSEPTNTVVENHGRNNITISIYEETDGFFAAYSFSIGVIAKAAIPALITATIYPSAMAARNAAKEEIKELCSADRRTKKIFLDFIVVNDQQLDLFT